MYLSVWIKGDCIICWLRVVWFSSWTCSGRFDVFDDDPEQDILDSCNGIRDIKQKHYDEEKDILRKDDQKNGREYDIVADTDQIIEPDNVEEKVSEQEYANQKSNQISIIEFNDDAQEDRYNSDIK